MREMSEDATWGWQTSLGPSSCTWGVGVQIDFSCKLCPRVAVLLVSIKQSPRPLSGGAPLPRFQEAGEFNRSGTSREWPVGSGFAALPVPKAAPWPV